MAKLQKILRYLGNVQLYANLFHNLATFRRYREAPVILGGCPRSGTTLLMSLLDVHPEIHVIPFETAVLNARSKQRRLFKSDSLHYWFCRFQIKAYLFSTRLKGTANRWCEKTPRNILNIDEILRIFKGDIKVINIYRDGRDVVASKHGSLGYIATPSLWRESVLAARKFEGADYIMSIRYEDLILNPLENLERIRKFLGLKTRFDLTNWVDKSSVRAGKSLLTGRHMPYDLKDISRSSVGNWQRSASPHVKDFLASPELMEMNRSLGYE